MCAMLLNLVLVIYTRFSSELQSSKSCADQEREAREQLTRMGIDHSNAIVIEDRAQSGTNSLRDGFVRLQAMLSAGTIGMLVVDDQSRLSRSDNTFAFITDLVYSGGRFISTGEGIDTDQTGWELRVRVMELHNSTTISELGRRVRRGQLGRVLGQLSAGDFCYGYESFLVDPERAHENRGPKPERGLRINEEEANWVRRIFEWFNAERSIAWIASELTRQGAPRGRRRRSDRWRQTHVRHILQNEKYIAIWRWGATRTIRNSQGRRKQIAVPAEQQVVVQRPALRIIDDTTWAETQERLAYLKEVYGMRPGQRHRGPRVHHTSLYPAGLLPGLVFCAMCGSRMWQESSGRRLCLGCPNRGADEGCCGMTTRVPMERAEEAILEFLVQLLTSWPEWLETALDAMREQIEEIALRVPEEVANDERLLREIETQITNLVDALAEGRVSSQAVRERLDGAECEAERLRKKITDARKLLSAPIELPDDAWIDQQLTGLAAVLREGGYEASLLLRKIIGRIEAEQVIPPGKTRGFARLKFHINSSEALKAIFLAADSSQGLGTLLTNFCGDDSSEEFVIDLGSLTLMDQWAPRIAEMRAQGTQWTEIVEITGLDLNRAYIAWKRYVDALQATNDSGNESTPESDNSDDDSTDSDEAA